jgi:hypothetical protein
MIRRKNTILRMEWHQPQGGDMSIEKIPQHNSQSLEPKSSPMPPEVDDPKARELYQLAAIFPEAVTYNGECLPSVLFGYDVAYPVDIKVGSTIEAGRYVSLCNHFQFLIHLTYRDQQAIKFTTTPESDQPFHPQFGMEWIGGKRVSHWKIPRNSDPAEGLAYRLIRLMFTLLYFPELMRPNGYAPANTNAWHWFRQQGDIYPTGDLSWDPAKLSLLGESRWMPVEMARKKELAQLESIQTETKLSSKTKESAERERQFVPKQVDWPNYEIDRWAQTHEGEDREDALYFTRTAFARIPEGSEEKSGESPRIGLLLGMVYKKRKDGALAAWVEEVHELPLDSEPLSPENLDRLVNDARELSSQSKSLIVGWFVRVVNGSLELTSSLQECHREQFKQAWSFLVLCAADSRKFRVYVGTEPQPSKGYVLARDDRKPEKHKRGLFGTVANTFKRNSGEVN